MKLSKSHTIYEIWSEQDAESTFIDHKPTLLELFTISLDKKWIGLLDSSEGQRAFVDSLIVEKLPIYTYGNRKKVRQSRNRKTH